MKAILYLALPYINIVLMYFFIRQLVHSHMPFWKAALILLTSSIASIPKLFQDGMDPSTQVFSTFFIIVAVFIYAFALFQEQRGKVLLYSVFFWGLQALSDSVAYWVFVPRLGENPMDYTVGQMLICMLLTWCIYIPSGAVCVLLGRCISMERYHRFYLLYLVFPVSQGILMVCSMLEIQNLVWVSGVVLGLVAEMLLLHYTVSQDQRKVLEDELENVCHVLELEQMHYSAVEQKQEELAHIRHDFNNQLSVIRRLLRQGEQEDAQKMIQTLSGQIDSTRENRYHTIPVVNAVLTEKEKESRQAGVKLVVDLRMAPNIRIEPLNLCSIFSNLLDNAIRAAKESGSENPEVVLTAAMEGDYLFIKTVNPARAPEKKTERRSGYGVPILKNLAKHYDGNYQAHYKDHTYTALVSLLAL